jgi:flagellar biosynthesis anti-sigma factor FlgM
MKINHNDTNGLTGATDPTVRAAATRGSEAGKPSTPSASGDQLTISPEARLLQAARDAEPSAIRQDVVDRARKALDAGQVGTDASSLANALIDDWMQKL